MTTAAHRREPRPRTVLHEVVDSARALTGARYGAIATIDDTGAPRGLRRLGLRL